MLGSNIGFDTADNDASKLGAISYLPPTALVGKKINHAGGLHHAEDPRGGALRARVVRVEANVRRVVVDGRLLREGLRGRT